MFDYFKKHTLTISEDVPEKSVNTDVDAVAPKARHDVAQPRATGGKPKKDKVFFAILIVFAVILAVGFVTGVGTTSGDVNVEDNFKFRFNITDGIFILGLVIGYVVMHIRKGRGH